MSCNRKECSSTIWMGSKLGIGLNTTPAESTLSNNQDWLCSTLVVWPYNKGASVG